MKTAQVLNSVIIGIAAGSQPIFGYNYGAERYDRVKETLKKVLKISFVISIIAFLLFQLIPDKIIGIFGNESELYVEFACMAFRIYLMLYFIDTLQLVGGLFFQAIGQVFKSAIISLSRQILILIPALLLFAKLFGINSNAVGYVVSDDEPDAKLYSVFKNMKNKKTTAVAADIFESYGTIRFINMFPLVIKAMQTGGTLVVDEFDASIHPMALMSIINVFHNDDVNIHHAQLIFNTHNPIFLNSNLFRRDEIKFVERDDDTHDSVLYALSDFGTTGDKGVRKHEDYMSKYFISQYGAIKDIDFTPIFEEILCDEKEG